MKVRDHSGRLRAPVAVSGLGSWLGDPAEDLMGGKDGDAGADPAALERALLGGGATIPLEELGRLTGMAPAVASLVWHALGFADSEPPDRLYSPVDVEGLTLVNRLAEAAGADEEFAVELMRGLGHHMSRLVTWQVIALAERMVAPGDATHNGTSQEGAGRAAQFIAEHLDDLDRMVSYGARRHLAAVLKWMQSRGEADALRFPLSVGFADMVSYTTMSQQMDAVDLAQLVARFEAVSANVVLRQGGRVIKTVGDEVLFVADTPQEALDIAVDLADAMAADPALLDVRVGVATGQVVSRLGDVFGPTVNLAHRLTEMALPGTVLADDATIAALVDRTLLDVTSLGELDLAGVGLVTANQVRRS
jgi:adenylate cyclase